MVRSTWNFALIAFELGVVAYAFGGRSIITNTSRAHFYLCPSIRLLWFPYQFEPLNALISQGLFRNECPSISNVNLDYEHFFLSVLFVRFFPFNIVWLLRKVCVCSFRRFCEVVDVDDEEKQALLLAVLLLRLWTTSLEKRCRKVFHSFF